MAITLIIAVAPAAATAEIAVFVDGRILKVEDAYLDGDEIVLDLLGGGRMVVPALRIERVVADEIEAPDTATAFRYGDCPPVWNRQPLEEWVPFRQQVLAAAQGANLDPKLLVALVQAESAFDPDAVSRVGAKGLTQLMPAAAADQRVFDVFDPAENLRGGAGHLRMLLDRFEDLPLALAAYNAGATTVDTYNGVPPYKETHSYVRRVLESFCPVE
jgi:soluble lytic murein transglycosylase-like protein